MAVEQRLQDALIDLEAMLGDGTSVYDALKVCSDEYGFKAEVLEIRARKVLGDLEEVGFKVRNRRMAQSKAHLEETAIVAYLAEKPGEAFPDWFAKRVGRRPTTEERQEFTLRHILLSRCTIPKEGMYD